MAHRLLPALVLLGASLAAIGPALAQAPSDSSSPPAAAPTPTQESNSSAAPTKSPAPAPPSTPATKPTATPAEPAASPAPTTPSADTLKKARMAGYHPETRRGTTMYCQETANIGTRFPTKKCIDESQLKSVVDVHNDEASNLRQPGACAGAACSPH